MRVLVAWDDPEEVETLTLFLNVDNTRATIHMDREAFLRDAASTRDWDAVLLPIDRPDARKGMETFLEVRRLLPDTPVVGACFLKSTIRLAGFLAHGLRAYVIRDEAKDFIFLLQTTLQSTIEAVQADRERHISSQLREEVESVRRLQEAIIPRTLPEPRGYRICGRYEAAELHALGGRSVVLAGGDYYDAFETAPDELYVLLADAAGHGMKACMSVMIMHTLVQMIRDHLYDDTAAFMTAVNRHLCDQTIIREGGGFITLLFGRLNTASHEFEWTSAGHPVPLLHILESRALQPLGTIDDGGMVLGIDSEAQYVSQRLEVPEGSRLLLYTDGLEEAFPSGLEECRQFGVSGIRSTLAAHAQAPLETAMQALFRDSNAHTQGAGRHDDTTVVLIERQRNGAPVIPLSN